MNRDVGDLCNLCRVVMLTIKHSFVPVQMDEKSHLLESELESVLQESELCLLSGETASLYVNDMNIASLPNGPFFSLLIC